MSGDDTRHAICVALSSLGVDARLAERGRLEEKAGPLSGCTSVGLIDVLQGPIRWINVAICSSPFTSLIGHRLLCGVPDSNLSHSLPHAKISAVPVKEFPVVGKVVDLRWKGEDHGTGIIDRLGHDSGLKRLMLEVKKELSWSSDPEIEWVIRFHPDLRSWVIGPVFGPNLVAREKIWQCLQKIARHLLVDWPDCQASRR